MKQFKSSHSNFSNIEKSTLSEVMSQLRRSNSNLKFHYIPNTGKIWSEAGGINLVVGTIEEISYRIHGYDRMMMEDYVLPEKYKTQNEAKALCKVDEYVKAANK